MRYMMSTSRRTGQTDVHRYLDTEMAEIFGSDVARIDRTGLLVTPGTIWVDMERAAKKATSRVAMALSKAK